MNAFARTILGLLLTTVATAPALSAPHPLTVPLDGAVEVACHLEPVHGVVPNDTDLGGRFRYHVSSNLPAGESQGLSSQILVLDGFGNVVTELPVDDQDLIQVSVRDPHEAPDVRDHVDGCRWAIRAPGTLVRAEAKSGFAVATAYCGPYAAVRIDRPEDVVFTSHADEPDAPVRLGIAVARMLPGSLRLYVDCTDVTAALGAQFPGGPYHGSVNVDGDAIQIQSLHLDTEHGTLAVSLSGLPGGAHKVVVIGTPEYAADLPPGSQNWRRPLGVLRHEREIQVFRNDITAPNAEARLAGGPVRILGVASHGQPIPQIRVHGLAAQILSSEFIPATSCRGQRYVVEYAVNLPEADLRRDFLSGDDATSALDPGVNYVSSIAADGTRHAANDRVRFSLGEVRESLARLGKAGTLAQAAPHCPGPAPPNDFQVERASFGRLSDAALTEAFRGIALEPLRAAIEAGMDKLRDQDLSIVLQSRPCPVPASAVGSAEIPGTPSVQSGGPGAKDVFRPQELRFRVDGPREVIAQHEMYLTMTADDFSNPSDQIRYEATGLPAGSELVDRSFHWFPTCEQVGSHTIEFRAYNRQHEAFQTVTIVVTNDEVPRDLPMDVHFDKIDWQTQYTDVHARVAKMDDGPRIVAGCDTGPGHIAMTAHKCFFDLFGCWFGIEIPVDIYVQNIRVVGQLDGQQAICGLGNGDPKFLIDRDHTAVETVVHRPEGKGLFGFVVDFFAAWIDLFLFDLDNMRFSFLDRYLIDEVEKSLLVIFQAVCPDGKCFPVLDLHFAEDLPPAVPLHFENDSSQDPDLLAGTAFGNGALGLAFHSGFTPLTFPTPDPTPLWSPNPRTFRSADCPSADMVMGGRTDLFDQMMSELASTGRFRGRFETFRLADLSNIAPPDLMTRLAALGVTPDTRILLTFDLAQDATGHTIPPIVALVDDPTTAPVEMRVRTQLMIRAVLPRNQVVGDDRGLCSCVDPRPDCWTAPCKLFEDVLKLNLYTECSLEGDAATGVSMQFRVKRVQALNRLQGFGAYEAVSSPENEQDRTTAETNSPILNQLAVSLNANLPPFAIPHDIITLYGYVKPVRIRLATWNEDGGFHPPQDFVGILADVESRPPLLGSKWPVVQANAAPNDPVPVTAAAGQAVPSTVKTTAAQQSVRMRGNVLGGGRRMELSFTVPAGGRDVRSAVYDVRGRVIAPLADDHREAGNYTLTWDGRDRGGVATSPGVYFVLLRIGEDIHRETVRVIGSAR